MVKVENYPKAYEEIYVILQNMEPYNVEEIPNTFLSMIEERRDKDYHFELEENKELKEQNLLRETKAILTYMYTNYWATEEEKKEILNKYKREEIEEEQIKKEKYGEIEVFKNRNQLIEDENKNKDITIKETDLEITNKENKEKETMLIERKESLFSKILIKIKKAFNKNKD